MPAQRRRGMRSDVIWPDVRQEGQIGCDVCDHDARVHAQLTEPKTEPLVIEEVDEPGTRGRLVAHVLACMHRLQLMVLEHPGTLVHGGAEDDELGFECRFKAGKALQPSERDISRNT